MNQRNDKGQRHGSWEIYHDNGQLDCKGSYVNGFEYGLWESYWMNGKLHYKGSYINETRIGFWLYGSKQHKEFYL